MNDSAQEQSGGFFRDRVQHLLRSSILDTAWANAAKVSWSQVRMADLADQVGVSRQTIYNEFGSKDDLVAVLFERELARFLDGVEERMLGATSFDPAMRGSLNWLLDEVAGHEVLGRMVDDARAGSTDGLIPLLTVQSQAIIKPVRERVVAILVARWPAIDPAAAEVPVDLTVRFVLGELIMPTDLDRDLMVDAILAMTGGLRRATEDAKQ